MDRDDANEYYYFDEMFYNSILTDLKYYCNCFNQNIRGVIES